MPDIPKVRADWAAYHDNMTVMDESPAGCSPSSTPPAWPTTPSSSTTATTARAYRAISASSTTPACTCRSSSTCPRSSDIWRRKAIFGRAARATGPPGFVDLAPTVLSLAGLPVPAHLQGRAFMGRAATPAAPFVFGTRARMDERYDLQRAVRDERYVYIRNATPHRAYGQYLAYSALMPSWQAWKRLYEAGRLSPRQSAFWETKPAEELYDLETDADEVTNIAALPAHRPALERLRAALDAHTRDARDLGFLPEDTPHRVPAAHQYGHDPVKYDLEAIRTVANQATDAAVPLGLLRAGLTPPHPTVRYGPPSAWSCAARTPSPRPAADLERMLTDEAPGARAAAAEALAATDIGSGALFPHRHAGDDVGYDDARGIRGLAGAERPGARAEPAR